MRYKVLRQKSGFQEFIWFDEFNQRYTSEIPHLLNHELNLDQLQAFYKSHDYQDIDLSDCELVDYVLIEEKQIYVKLLMLLKPVLNITSLIKLSKKNNSKSDISDINKDETDVYNTIIDTEVENCELIFSQLKTIFNE
jgi:hypothetical protein